MKTLLPEINSADKRFHNGNPATGEQGTRVTDTWLNDVQDRVRDVQAEAHYVLQKAGFTPKAEAQTQLYQAIVKIIGDNRRSATTTQKGEVQLTSDTGLDSETLGLTAKAGKILSQAINSVRLALNNYIPLRNRSSAVNSNDENNVATSKAVKTAYDKGVEAKTAADNAQRTADEAVRFNRNYFAGDLNTLNDKHEVCYLEQAQTKNRNFPSNAYQWGILHVYSNGSLGSQVYYADNGELWARTRWHSHDWNNWKRLDGLNTVSKSGDTMTGNLTIDTANSLLIGKRNGTNKYAVGLRNSSSDDAVFINYTYDTVLELLRDAIRSNKTLIAAGMTIENSDYAGVNLKNLSGRYVRIEGNPHSAANMLTFAYREANGSNINVVGLPRKNGTLAIIEEVVTDIRLGAATVKNIGGTKWDTAGNGMVITGIDNGGWDDVHANNNLYVRPIQKRVNGTWITISNS